MLSRIKMAVVSCLLMASQKKLRLASFFCRDSSLISMRRILYEEFWWAIHNLIVHPVNQLCYWIGKIVPSVGRFGDWLHDATTPTREEQKQVINIGLDYHDTISYEPEFFVKLIKIWPGEVFIVTGTPPSKIHQIEKSLEDLGLLRSDFKDILMGYEYNKADMSLDHFERMAKHKLKLLQDNNIDVYCDDNPFYVSYIKDHGILTLQPIMSEKYLQEFEQADPFFTCNLQKMQFDYLKNLQDTEMLKAPDISTDPT